MTDVLDTVCCRACSLWLSMHVAITLLLSAPHLVGTDSSLCMHAAHDPRLVHRKLLLLNFLFAVQIKQPA